MARYVDADCKRCRREKTKLFLKGAKCESPKCPFEKRPYPPGQHGRGRSKDSEYLLQLREKQKAVRMYGVLEKQFSNYYKEAQRQSGKTGENLLRLLESRLDNVVFRLGFANSRAAARQLVAHGHIRVDGRKVDVASYATSPGEKIEVRDRTSSKQLATRAVEEGQGRSAPAWLVVLPEQLNGQIVREPAKEELPSDVNVQIIVEFYSR